MKESQNRHICYKINFQFLWMVLESKKKMGNAKKLIEKMKNNPLNWRIEDLKIVAIAHNMTVRMSGGSHVVFYHDDFPENLCVPAHRPIKPVYVKRFLAFIDKLED